MIEIDKADKLYKYLTKLGIDNIDEVYLDLASNGIADREYAIKFFKEDFDIDVEDIDELLDSKVVVDYYNDLKKVKRLNKKALQENLNTYSKSKDNALRDEIVNTLLKDTFYDAIGYGVRKKQVDLMDVVQNANIGLLKAIDKYNPQNGIDINEYVLYYVREQLNDTYKEKNNG